MPVVVCGACCCVLERSITTSTNRRSFFISLISYCNCKLVCLRGVGDGIGDGIGDEIGDGIGDGIGALQVTSWDQEPVGHGGGVGYVVGL